MNIRVLFFGTAEFAVPALKALISSQSAGISSDLEVSVVGLVTQPDAPRGRKRVLTPPPTKVWAQENAPDLKIYQPEKLKLSAAEILAETAPDLIVVAAYGQIIPAAMIHYPKYKCINIHGSLLPKYRGAVPIEMSLLNGDTQTGVSLLQMTPELDDGPVIAERRLEIRLSDDAVSLRAVLSKLGAELLLNNLARFVKGEVELVDQLELGKREDRELSYCFVTDFTRAGAEIKSSDTAEVAFNKVRAYSNAGGAWVQIYYKGKPVELKIWKANINPTPGKSIALGKLAWQDNKLVLHQVGGKLELVEAQLAGRERAPGKQYEYLVEDEDDMSRIIVQVGTEVLFIRRHKLGADYFVLPGGHLKRKETPLAGAIRELREETAIKLTEAELKLLHTQLNPDKGSTYYYTVNLAIKPEVALAEEELMRSTPENSFKLDWIDITSEEMRNFQPNYVWRKLKPFLKV